jgi:DNA-binding beta-propeller fold protein YncE
MIRLRHIVPVLGSLAFALLLPSVSRAAISDLYVGSLQTGSVLRYDGTSGAFVSAFVPSGSGGLAFPTGVIFGPDGNLYVSSLGSAQVMRYSGSTGAPLPSGANPGAVFIPQGNGLGNPQGLAFDASNNIYVASAQSNSVLKYDSTGAFIGTFASGNGLLTPSGVIFGPNGNLFVNSSGNNQVLEFNGTTGAFLTAFATTNLSGPLDLKFGPDGNLYVSNNSSTTISEFNGITGSFLQSLSGGLNGPAGLAFGPTDNRLYVANLNTNEVRVFNSGTSSFDVFVTAGSGGLNQPDFLTFGPIPAGAPEPASIILVGMGLIGLVGYRARVRTQTVVRGKDASGTR